MFRRVGLRRMHRLPAPLPPADAEFNLDLGSTEASPSQSRRVELVTSVDVDTIASGIISSI